MNARPIHVHAVGMACPLGLTAEAACAARRAGIVRFQELPYRTDEHHVIRGSYLPSLGAPGSAGSERWMQLSILALRDLGRCVDLANRPIILALPPEAATRRPRLLARLSEALPVPISPQRVQFIDAGSSGGHRALAVARAQLTAREADEVVICAADSLVSARRLQQLAEGRRLLTEDNSDGIIPGEAAAAVLVSLRSRGALGTICGIGFGEEPARLDNDVPLRGQGIIAAARAALAEAGLAMHDVHVRVADASGEAYGFREQVIAVSRLLRRNLDSFPLWLGALALGDTGAAAGLCDLVYVLHTYRRGCFPGRRVVAYASSDLGLRSAIVIDSEP